MKELDKTPSLVFAERKTRIFLVILLLFLDLLVFILPYWIRGYTIPVGWDTAWYIRNMRLIKEQGIHSFFIKTHEINLFCLLEYVFASIFNISFTLTEAIVPVMIGMLFPLVNFQMVKKLAKSQKLALVAMLFTIIDYNTVRMTGLLHRNLFCFLLTEIAVLLVLPGFLAKPSKKRFLIFVLLLVMAGLSQMDTFAIAMFMLFISLILYLKKRLLKTAKLLFLCLLTPTLIIILLKAPFLPIFMEEHIVFNPAVRSYRQNFIADPWCYLVSFGAGLIPLYIFGMYELLKKTSKNLEKYRCLFISLWNAIVIAGSFLPVFSVRVPGWRFLILATVPPVATLGFVQLFLEKGSFSKKKALILVALIAVSLIAIIVNQSRSYRPWISENEYRKLMWISNATQHDSNIIFVLSLEKGRDTFELAELHRHWIWAVVGTRTNVYFGDIKCLIESQPTAFENQFLNSTSHIFWNELEDFTLNGARIYTIEEWYENLLNETYLVEVYSGIYSWSFIGR
jgi:hypothetical protein